MYKGLSSVVSLLLLAILGISTLVAFNLYFQNTLSSAELKTAKEQQKLQESLNFLPQITSVRALKQDPYSAIAVLEYYGFEEIPLGELYLQIVLPNTSAIVTGVNTIIRPEDCLTSDFSSVKPGAYCLLLVNLTKIYQKQIQYTFSNSSIGIFPLVETNATAAGYYVGEGKGSSPSQPQEDMNFYPPGSTYTPGQGSETPPSAPPQRKILLLGVGFSHNIAQSEDLSLFSWGQNTYGELGLGYANINPKPLRLQNSIVGNNFSIYSISDIALGGFYTCALLSNSSVYCWGDNGDGQLGLGDTNNRLIPTAVKALEGLGVAEIVTGYHHTCALLSNGSVYCWGSNNYGQLGLGDTTNRPTPTAVTALEGLNVTQLAAGAYHTCALLENSSVYCWGSNSQGQLGTGDGTDKYTPVAVKALEGLNVTQLIAGGRFTCALLSNSSVYCWGENTNGQLGLGDTLDRYKPTAVTALEGLNVSKMTAGYTFVCALLENSSVYCWGSNSYGQLGLGDTTDRNLPTAVTALEGLNVSKIVAGFGHTCALLANSTVYCWGENTGGQIALFCALNSPNPLAVKALEGLDVVGIAVKSYYHTCALLANGSVYCWGYNGYGQLGVGDTSKRVAPTLVGAFPLENVTKLYGGVERSCALLSNGTIYCWGENGLGELGFGDSADRLEPAAVKTLEGLNVERMFLGSGYHTCALLENSTVYCWGSNEYGQLGLGDTTTRYKPTAVTALEGLNVTQLAVGAYHTCALLSNSSVYCWGSNSQGQLGLGDTTTRYKPTAVTALEGLNVSQLIAGGYHTCALLENSTVYCWGYNAQGQLGLGDTTNRPTPTAVTALEGLNVTQLAVGAYHTCALLANNSIYCWGYNAYGQLGLGDTTNRLLPALVKALEPLNISEFLPGGYHTCALLTNGSVYCWGKNNYGQLGLGYATTTAPYNESLPRVVVFP